MDDTGNAALPPETAAQGYTTTRRRSDGSGFLSLGYVTMGLAAVITILAFGSASPDPGFAPLIVASGLMSLSLFFIATGLIVRAIWFLPSDLTKATKRDL